MKIAISAESTIDLTKELLKQYEITTIPFSITLGDKILFDGEFNTKEIFDHVNKTKQLPKTSAINECQFEEYFSNLLKTYDAVIHFSLSSEISATCSIAKKAAEKLKNVFVIDSRSLSTGIALPAIYASKLAKQGLKPEVIVEKVTARISYIQASFVLERLDYLYKGGRCSGLKFLLANMLKLKPQICVIDGKMQVGKKYRGKTEIAVKEYCADVLAKYNTPDLDVGFVTYTTATPEMVTAAKTAMKNAGFKNIYETTAGATITCHCGEHTLGILFFNDGNKRN